MSALSENRTIREIEALTPRLRETLRFSIQEQGGRRVCVIEDPATSKFHRIGLEEFRFLRALDGTRTVAAILAQLARSRGGETFTEGEALEMLGWAKEHRLLAMESARAGATAREESAQVMKTAATWLNPLVLKLPLGRPDRFFSWVEPRLRWALGWSGFFVWLGVVLAGFAQVAVELPRFLRETDGFLARDNWLWLFVVWAGLKVAHEFGHGVVAKRFGAAVREAGVIFVLLVPMGYVDATASLGLASKWRRIAVACAGIYLELFLAAIAAMIWAHSGAGLTATVAHNAVLAGSVLTLFFNANPLMRFDGYYVLSDLLEIPNLATRGRAWVQRGFAWLLIGGRLGRPAGREEWLAAGYGTAAWLWQLLVLAALVAGASGALRGGGLLFAVMAAALWIALPLWNFGKNVAAGAGSIGALALRATALLALASAILFLPWKRAISSHGVVELAETQVLRAECPGFVERELVRDGDVVEAGQLLIALRNEEASAELARARLDLAQQELRARLAYTRQDVATFQAEQARAESLRGVVAQRESYVATLEIRAPAAGRVTNRRLGQLGGSFFRAGEEVARVGSAEGSDVKVAVSQQDEPHLRGAAGRGMRVRIEGRGGSRAGSLVRMEATASREPAHPALGANAGGPLMMRRRASGEAERGAEHELAEPHFTATVRLASGEIEGAGERARVRWRSDRRVHLWGEMQGAVERWLGRYAVR